MDFTDRHVVITGGTGALGTAVVGQLAEAGAICHIPSFEPEIRPDWPHINNERVHVTLEQDLSDESTVTAFYAGLDGLWASIHCAGGFAMAPIAETSLADFHKMVARNLDSCFLCCREAIRAMRRSEPASGGRIVNVAARQALEPRQGAGQIAYTTTKAGVAALSVALAQEVASERIWVNAIAPSIINTANNRRAMPNANHDRWPTTDDLAATILWLASPQNAAGRGGIIPVYGQT